MAKKASSGDFLFRGRKILSPDVKNMVAYLVAKLHVGESDEDVAAHVASRLKSAAPSWFIAAVKKEAVKAHHKNLKLYTDVMGGRAGR